MTKEIVSKFDFEKETKNTVRFEERPDKEPSIGYVYIRKWAWKSMGEPKTIEIRLTAS